MPMFSVIAMQRFDFENSLVIFLWKWLTVEQIHLKFRKVIKKYSHENHLHYFTKPIKIVTLLIV